MVDEASKIREEIASGRAELAETVQALVEKADVKARVRESISESTEHIQQKASQAASQLADTGRHAASSAKSARRHAGGLYAAGGAGVLVLLTVLLVRRGRSR